MNRFYFWQRWLAGVGIFLTLFGIAMAFINFEWGFIKSLFRLVDSAFWSSSTVPADARMFQRWMYSAYGAVMIALGIIIFFIAVTAFRNREKWAWLCILYSSTILAVLDSLYALAYGLSNWTLIGSVIFISLFLLPLVPTKKYFR